MAINLQTLGNKLKGYRLQLSQSHVDVSRATGIEGQRLASIENGQTEPSGDEVLILADHFQCDFKYFISNEQLAPFEQTEVLYRASDGEFTAADRKAIQEFLYLCDTEAYLLRALGRSVPQFDIGKLAESDMSAPAEIALKVRAALGYSDTDLISDVYKAFRALGLHVFRRKLGNSNISGLFVTHPVAGKCALVNSSEDIYRQRFSAAHEVAHSIFDVDQPVSVSVHSDEKNAREIRANKFASSFLMPPALLKKIQAPNAWTDEKIIDWASRLMVSCAALAFALRAAKIITQQSAEHFSKLKVPHTLKSDPELSNDLTAAQRERKQSLLDLGLSDFYVQLCFDGFQSGVISLGRLSEALLSSPTEITELSSLYGRALHVY